MLVLSLQIQPAPPSAGLLKMHSGSSKYEPWHSGASVASGSLSGLLVCLKALRVGISVESDLHDRTGTNTAVAEIQRYRSPAAAPRSHPGVENKPIFTSDDVRTLTSAQDPLRGQVTSQLMQVRIPPVVQLPASDPQVEAQPRRVRVHVARPVHLFVAVRPTGAPPAGRRCEQTNSSRPTATW